VTAATAERGGFLPRGRERCPDCGSTGRDGQLICLDCGARRALRPQRRSRRPHPAIVALVAIVVVGGAAVGLVIAGMDDGKPNPGATPAASAPSPGASEKANADAARLRREARARRAAAAGGAWPAGRGGYTVVLANMGDRASAEQLAKTVTDGGERAGVIAADEHPNLGGGLFLVYSGRYDDEAAATQAAARLGAAHQGAYPQFIQSGSSTDRPAASQSP
jgi:hypothetical protein